MYYDIVAPTTQQGGDARDLASLRVAVEVVWTRPSRRELVDSGYLRLLSF